MKITVKNENNKKIQKIAMVRNIRALSFTNTYKSSLLS